MKSFLLSTSFILLASSILAGEQYERFNPMTTTDNRSGFVLSKKLTHDELVGFFEFATQEVSESNFGLSRDIFECIAKNSNKFPLCYYYLGTIYSTVSGIKDNNKAKNNFENFISAGGSNRENSYFIQQAYASLIELEYDHVKLIKLAKQSLGIGKNSLSLSSTLRAYQKVYANTNDEKYAQLADAYSKELNVFNNTSFIMFNNPDLMSNKK